MQDQRTGAHSTWDYIRVGDHIVAPELAVDVPPAIVAQQLGVTLDAYLAAVERWAEGPGFTRGIRVNPDTGTITQAGQHDA